MPGVFQRNAEHNFGKDLTLITDPCRPNFRGLLPYAVAFISVLVLLFAVFLILNYWFKCLYRRLKTWYKSDVTVSFKFFVLLLWRQFSLVNTCLAYSDMFTSIDINSPDNCMVYNDKVLWIANMGIFRSLDGTQYPPPANYSNFKDYATLLYSGFPARNSPQLVQQNIDRFAQGCGSFILGYCAYNSDLFLCEQISDPEGNVREFFSKLLYASVAVFALKELLKQLLVLHVLCFGSEPSAASRAALCVPFMFYSLGSSRFWHQVVKPKKGSQWKSTLFSLFYDGRYFCALLLLYYAFDNCLVDSIIFCFVCLIFSPGILGSAQLLALTFYFTTVVNKSGISVASIISMLISCSRIIWRIVDVITELPSVLYTY